ncbi:hypothetical protein BS78_09G151500 [Paspalum vaginatum]|nr:hypothetical protein BS78_09G151500 [Paspalum vaginatum]KAJ1263010.1 hypothetical protein BS78_09G151500 [Paspalum vaginatum]
MSRFARVGPWAGVPGAGAASEPAADVARDDAAAASSMRGAGAGADASTATNANAISFGFAATAVLVSMFLLMAIFEHLIKPGMASHDEDDGGNGNGDGEGGPRAGLPPGRPHQLDASPPDKLGRSPKVEPVAGAPDLTVLMPGHRYPTFLAQPAPLALALAPRPREGVRWPPHDRDRRPAPAPVPP